MSRIEEAAVDENVCANCGIAEVDNITLEECDGCDLVRYCSDKCREEHREEHEEECNRRAKELHDRKLFTQPNGTHEGECPICFLPMPIDTRKSRFYYCCSQIVCNGCVSAHIKSNIHDLEKAGRCPFCREPVVDDDENDKRMMKRVKANDPFALSYMGANCYNEGDYDAAFVYLTKAAELDNSQAHYILGCMYYEGKGVEKNMKKEVYHLEKAAIGGHPTARHNLAATEGRNGRIERAVKHFIIAAKLGYEESMKMLWGEYSCRNITKEDLEATLRTHQAAIEATKSSAREEADAFLLRKNRS